MTVLLLSFLFLSFPHYTAAQNAAAQTGGHRGAVTAILYDDEKGRILSAGTDGFIQVWSRETNTAAERFQISHHSISSMVQRPGKPQFAFVEANRAGYTRISVWDYEQKANLFTLPFGDTVDHVYYSAGGSFLMATGRGGVNLIHSETGASINSPRELTGTVTFAATGRSERSMIVYSNSGSLSYWNLETGARTNNFNVPRDIKSPLLFGNNRFIAGFDNGGLLILDAVSGTVLLREPSISRGALFTGNPEVLEFVCLVPGSGSSQFGTAGPATLYHISIRNLNRLEILNRRTVAYNTAPISCGAVIGADSAALGTDDGRVALINYEGRVTLMGALNQQRIEEFAASSNTLAFRTENSQLGFIPLDYTRLSSSNTLRLENSAPYTSIAADPLKETFSGVSLPRGADFLLWQPENTRSFPLIKHISGVPERGSVSETFIDKLTLRFPLRAVSIYRNRILFLDSVGNIRVINEDSGEITFTFTVPGSQDAVFINEERVIIARNAGTGGTPFLMINIITGETVPLPFPAALGVKVYRGPSGFIYGVVINRSGNNFKTSLVSINTSSPGRSYSFAEFEDEDTQFTIAESGVFLASTLGNGEARVFAVSGNSDSVNASKISLERSGFPQKIINGPGCFIALDSDGNITWHDPASGKILAVFRLFRDSWTLERDGRVIRGNVQGNF